ncbi:hypothetical protein Pan241w_29620 [Gimesia alba]|uniref:Transmembrane protein n=1 Tax=Gimesia alba TaxID=2527973 RepID=A0A517RG64_9PLAN|nr:hypothetical protein Pan241w_29620 [Gimesia alba]
MSERKRFKILQYLCSGICVLLVVYVLSIRPVNLLVVGSDNMEFEDYCEWFYGPLLWCMDQNDLFCDLIGNYMVFWSRFA